MIKKRPPPSRACLSQPLSLVLSFTLAFLPPPNTPPPVTSGDAARILRQLILIIKPAAGQRDDGGGGGGGGGDGGGGGGGGDGGGGGGGGGGGFFAPLFFFYQPEPRAVVHARGTQYARSVRRGGGGGSCAEAVDYSREGLPETAGRLARGEVNKARQGQTRAWYVVVAVSRP